MWPLDALGNGLPPTNHPAPLSPLAAATPKAAESRMGEHLGKPAAAKAAYAFPTPNRLLAPWNAQPPAGPTVAGRAAYARM